MLPTHLVLYKTLFIEFYISLTDVIYNFSFIFILLSFLVFFYFHTYIYSFYFVTFMYSFYYVFSAKPFFFGVKNFFLPFVERNEQLKNGLLYIHPLNTLFFYSFGFFLILIFYSIRLHIHLYSICISNCYFKKQFYYLVFLLTILLVISIVLGSYWSFQELSWNGWWDWDIIEIFNLFSLVYLGYFIHKSYFYFLFFLGKFLTVWVMSSITVHFGFYKSIHNFLTFSLSGQYRYYYAFFLWIFGLFWFRPKIHLLRIPTPLFYVFTKKKIFYSSYSCIFIFLYCLLIFINFYTTLFLGLGFFSTLPYYFVAFLYWYKSVIHMPISHICFILIFFIFSMTSYSSYYLDSLPLANYLWGDIDLYFDYLLDMVEGYFLHWFNVSFFFSKIFYIYIDYSSLVSFSIFVYLWAFFYFSVYFLFIFVSIFLVYRIFYKKLVY